MSERERTHEGLGEGAGERPVGPEPVPEPRRGDERRSSTLSALDPVAAYERRTTRIREEIARNRRGEYKVPTWVLVLALAGVIGIWALVLFVL